MGEVGFALLTLGVVIFLFIFYQLFGTSLTEQRTQSQLGRQFASAVASAHNSIAAQHSPATLPPSTTVKSTTVTSTATPVTSTAPPATATSTTVLPTSVSSGLPSLISAVQPGHVLAYIQIPKIGVQQYVVEGVAEADLAEGPGHYPGTPMPGQAGNVGIAGHRTTYGAPFYRLDELLAGDDVYITTTSGKYHYRVVDKLIVSPSDIGVLDQDQNSRLTLTTCNPRFSAAQRLIVVASLLPGAATPSTKAADPTATNPTATNPTATTTPGIATPGQNSKRPAGQRTPHSRVVTAPAGSGSQHPTTAARVNLGSGNPNAWSSTLGFGLLTIGLWILVRLRAARSRSWRWVPWLVGVPVCLIPLWFCFENVVRLLPANI